MKPLVICTATLIAAALILPSIGQQGRAPLRKGTWSTAAWDIYRTWDFYDGTDMRPTRIPAPDGRTVFVESPKINSDGHAVPDMYIERDGKRLSGVISADVAPEFAWAPDSKAFFITSSNGGAVGTFSTLVYLIHNGEIRKVDVDKQVRDDIARAYPACLPYNGSRTCTPEEQQRMAHNHHWVNVAGMKWIGGSSELLVVGNVPDSSGYGANMAKWMGYRINVPSGMILQRYTEAEFRHKWNYLKRDWN